MINAVVKSDMPSTCNFLLLLGTMPTLLPQPLLWLLQNFYTLVETVAVTGRRRSSKRIARLPTLTGAHKLQLAVPQLPPPPRQQVCSVQA
jgi:hypothetical protein